jgi:LPXTG-motif cell wall-anchored protein
MKVRGGGFVLGIGLLAVAAGVATAQQPSQTTSTQMGKPETTTTTRHVEGTVVSVNGNKVVGRDASGKHTEYTIPEGFKFQYQGKDIGVAELKPGMHVSATITTTTTLTPVSVMDVRKGTVLAVSGDNIIIRGPNGIRRFSNQDAQLHNAKVMRNGQAVSLSDLREGDVITAVIVTEAEPKIVTEREAKAMASSAPAPAPAPAHVAAAPAPAPAPAAAPASAPAPAKKLPKTASQAPLVGLIGALSIAVGLGLTLVRRYRTR